MESLIGQTLGSKYAIEALIGRGGMGVVIPAARQVAVMVTYSFIRSASAIHRRPRPRCAMTGRWHITFDVVFVAAYNQRGLGVTLNDGSNV